MNNDQCDCGTPYLYGYMVVHLEDEDGKLHFINNYSDSEYYYCQNCGDKDPVD